MKRITRPVRYVRQREEEGAAFVLCPDEPLHIGAVERDAGRLRAVYEAGRAVAGRRLPAMQAFLAAAARRVTLAIPWPGSRAQGGRDWPPGKCCGRKRVAALSSLRKNKKPLPEEKRREAVIGWLRGLSAR